MQERVQRYRKVENSTEREVQSAEQSDILFGDVIHAGRETEMAVTAAESGVAGIVTVQR